MVIKLINLNEIITIIERSLLALLTLFIITKMLGKKQISQLTVYDYVVSISIGSIAADSIISLDEHMVNGLLAIIIFGVVALAISYISIKSATLNNIINGKPTVLMENGEFNFPNLRQTKIPIYKFLEESRLNGYYDLNMINYAILETNGRISFLPKEEYQEINPKDLKRDLKNKLNKQTYSIELVIDGVVQKENLKDLGKDEEWLKNELKKQKVTNVDQILLLTIDQNDKLKLYKELI